MTSVMDHQSGEDLIDSIIREVAEKLRGEDDLYAYLRKISRTGKDMLAGRTVKKWRLDRFALFASQVGDRCLRLSYELLHQRPKVFGADSLKVS